MQALCSAWKWWREIKECVSRVNICMYARTYMRGAARTHTHTYTVHQLLHKSVGFLWQKGTVEIFCSRWFHTHSYIFSPGFHIPCGKWIRIPCCCRVAQWNHSMPLELNLGSVCVLLANEKLSFSKSEVNFSVVEIIYQSKTQSKKNISSNKILNL